MATIRTRPGLPMDTIDQLVKAIRAEEQSGLVQYKDAYSVNRDLHRRLVSYQRDKTERVTRWCKFKEAFSASFVSYVIERVGVPGGKVLDPFAGSGTTLFSASESGLDAVGIELLPNAVAIMDVQRILRSTDLEKTGREISNFASTFAWEGSGPISPFQHLTITQGAFPPGNETRLSRYLYDADLVDSPDTRQLLRFAAMCVLEDISYTRKDGQYLRWDRRAQRPSNRKSGFQKSDVQDFTIAIADKCRQMTEDIEAKVKSLEGYKDNGELGDVTIMYGSALNLLPSVEERSVDCIITSPPYCNRYDYTRTYALELAMLGVDDIQLKELRQSMLSCTVENKDKSHLYYQQHTSYQDAKTAFESQELLHLVLLFLNACLQTKKLNNNGIPRMVNNYFKELTSTVFECSRVLKAGAPLVLVNDNVRYQGVQIPVDLILSNIAYDAGFDIEHIWVLPNGKGSSSQQSIAHGRESIRKCVYVWRKR